EQTASVEPPPPVEPVPTPPRKPAPPPRQTTKPTETVAKPSEPLAAPPAPPPPPPPPVQTAVVLPPPETAEDDEPQMLAQTADGQLKVSGSSLGDGFSLRFEWDDSVKAAMFKLRETAWVVFDRPEEIRFNPRASAKAAGLPVLVQSKNGLATVLHVAIPADSVLVAGRAGNAWLLDVRRAGPWQQADTHPQGHALEATGGLFATKKPGQPVTIVDPDSGEILLAVPVRTAEVHFAQNEDHDSFHVLPTVQGMLFRPETDRFRLLIEDGGARVATLPDVVETRQPK
ncbi:MAG TPA: hypothetical protein VKS60_13680, partial [Stellaceae bacterium]|nr:hypothetical protein [Stellaceae bacterium]